MPPASVVRDTILSVGGIFGIAAAGYVCAHSRWWSWVAFPFVVLLCAHPIASLRWSLLDWRGQWGGGTASGGRREQVITHVGVMTYPHARLLMTTGRMSPMDPLWNVMVEAVQKETAITYAVHDDGNVEMVDVVGQ